MAIPVDVDAARDGGGQVGLVFTFGAGEFILGDPRAAGRRVGGGGRGLGRRRAEAEEEKQDDRMETHPATLADQRMRKMKFVPRSCGQRLRFALKEYCVRSTG